MSSKSMIPFVAGALALTAATGGIVALAALTSWWALFALLALCPLMMFVCGATMMSAMGGSRSGLGALGPCGAWRRVDLRATAAD